MEELAGVSKSPLSSRSLKAEVKEQVSLGNLFKVVYLNARSVKNKVPELQSFISTHNPDIIAITETWLDDTFTDIQLFGSGDFQVFRKDRNAHGGGVLLAIKSNYSPSLVPELQSDSCEIVWASYNCSLGRGLVGCCYRPPNSKKEYSTNLGDCLLKVASLRKHYDSISVYGDFNIHVDWSLPERQSSSTGDIIFDTFDTVGMTQILSEPTYTTSSGESHFLDLVFTNNPFIVDYCTVTDNLQGCDHLAVEVLFNITSHFCKTCF